MDMMPTTQKPNSRKISTALLTCTILFVYGCGGGGSSNTGNTVTTGNGATGTAGNPLVGGTSGTSGTAGSGSGVAGAPDWAPGVFESSNSFEAMCLSPRAGVSAQTGNPFPDLPGSTPLENHWLRSWTNETYLWYDEVTDRNPALYGTAAYFDLLKTDAVTGSGAPRDQFHFTYDTDVWEALSASGVSAGYGFQITFLSSEIPYEIAIAYTEPGSPAATAGISRGARILAIDGVSASVPTSQSDVDTLNAGLSPETLGETHSFTVQDLGATGSRTVNLTSASITSIPVQNVASTDTATGKVGYILFNDHIATAESQLITAFEQLQADSVSDLVLDLRYNGGGFLAIASEVAYMIAGAGQTNGEIFEQLVFNDKHPVFDPVTGELNDPLPFFDEALGFSATAGTALPSLNLPRVFILASSGTCSASESIINSLRGVGVEVILIGDTTCGKPYGFYPTDNCGTTYFSIQFESENAMGFSDYADGFSPQNVSSAGAVSLPGCGASDDFDNDLGDPNETMFATALAYRDSGTCTVSTKISPDGSVSISPTPTLTPKPAWLQNRVLDLPHE
jgi:carboxyl-terminal processing protease